jgi:hypothetical protein
VRQIKITRGNLVQHWGEEKEVLTINQRDFNVTRAT